MANNISSIVGDLRLNSIINIKYGVSEGSPLLLDPDTNNFSIDTDKVLQRADIDCAIADGSKGIAFGNKSYAGTNLYRLKYGDKSTNVWYLENVEGLSTGLAYSTRIINNYDNVGIILSINSDDNSISTTPFPNFININEIHDNIISTTYNDDDDKNSIWILGHPELGNFTVDGCLIATGYGTIAQKWCSIAEGRDTIAAGKYSHAEGYGTSAFGYSSHAEGLLTQANGQRSHTEGDRTFTYALRSHAEGYLTSAVGSVSHSEGQNCIARGNASHVEGLNSFAEGKASHAEGYSTHTLSDYTHAEGYQTSAYGGYSHTEGYLTRTGSGVGSHAEGFKTYAINEYSHAEGNLTSALGNCSHAAGASAIAKGDYSFCWSGKPNSTTPYELSGNGEFAINPLKGNNGFWIGNKTFQENLNAVSAAAAAAAGTNVSTLLSGRTFSKSRTPIEDMLSTLLTCFGATVTD